MRADHFPPQRRACKGRRVHTYKHTSDTALRVIFQEFVEPDRRGRPQGNEQVRDAWPAWLGPSACDVFQARPCGCTAAYKRRSDEDGDLMTPVGSSGPSGHSVGAGSGHRDVASGGITRSKSPPIVPGGHAATQARIKDEPGQAAVIPPTMFSTRAFCSRLEADSPFRTVVRPVRYRRLYDLTGEMADHAQSVAIAGPPELVMYTLDPTAEHMKRIHEGLPFKDPKEPWKVNHLFRHDHHDHLVHPNVRIERIEIPAGSRDVVRDAYPQCAGDPQFFNRLEKQRLTEWTAPLRGEPLPSAADWSIVAVQRHHCTSDEQFEGLKGQRCVVPTRHAHQHVGRVAMPFSGALILSPEDRSDYIDAVGKRAFEDYAIEVVNPGNEQERSFIAPWGGGNAAQFLNGRLAPNDVAHFVSICVIAHILDKRGSRHALPAAELFQLRYVPRGRQGLLEYEPNEPGYFTDRHEILRKRASGPRATSAEPAIKAEPSDDRDVSMLESRLPSPADAQQLGADGEEALDSQMKDVAAQADVQSRKRSGDSFGRSSKRPQFQGMAVLQRGSSVDIPCTSTTSILAARRRSRSSSLSSLSSVPDSEYEENDAEQGAAGIYCVGLSVPSHLTCIEGLHDAYTQNGSIGLSETDRGRLKQVHRFLERLEEEGEEFSAWIRKHAHEGEIVLPTFRGIGFAAFGAALQLIDGAAWKPRLTPLNRVALPRNQEVLDWIGTTDALNVLARPILRCAIRWLESSGAETVEDWVNVDAGTWQQRLVEYRDACHLTRRQSLRHSRWLSTYRLRIRTVPDPRPVEIRTEDAYAQILGHDKIDMGFWRRFILNIDEFDALSQAYLIQYRVLTCNVSTPTVAESGSAQRARQLVRKLAEQQLPVTVDEWARLNCGDEPQKRLINLNRAARGL